MKKLKVFLEKDLVELHEIAKTIENRLKVRNLKKQIFKTEKKEIFGVTEKDSNIIQYYWLLKFNSNKLSEGNLQTLLDFSLGGKDLNNKRKYNIKIFVPLGYIPETDILSHYRKLLELNCYNSTFKIGIYLHYIFGIVNRELNKDEIFEYVDEAISSINYFENIENSTDLIPFDYVDCNVIRLYENIFD